MPSQRIQRRIDALLDEAEQAAAGADWGRVRELALDALTLDPEHEDARPFLAMADRRLNGGNGNGAVQADVVAARPRLPRRSLSPSPAAATRYRGSSARAGRRRSSSPRTPCSTGRSPSP